MRPLLRKIVSILDGTPAEYGKRENGQSVVELALVMPILLVLLAGIAEMGWFTNNYLILLEASRVGAREGTKLVGDASPITWERGTVTLVDDPDAPVELNSRLGVYPLPPGTAGPYTPASQGQRREPELARGAFRAIENFRDSAPNTRPQCSSEFVVGFYSVVACQTLAAMSPLDDDFNIIPIVPDLNELDPIREEAPDFEPPHPRNDIIVSAFSLNRVPATQADCGGPDDEFNCAEAPNINALHRPYVQSGSDGFRNSAPLDASGNPNPQGVQIMVTGRYPTNANECAGDGRDPFDINNNGQLDSWEIDTTRLNILNDGGQLLDNGADTRNGMNYRGFSLTGQWENGGCVGSMWSVDRMEQLVNLQGVDITETEMNFLPDRQGLVLVEVFWRHELLIDLPLFGSMFRMMGGGGGVGDDTGYISVWAAFPISTVAFDLEFDRTCGDLLFFSDTMSADAIASVNCTIP